MYTRKLRLYLPLLCIGILWGCDSNPTSQRLRLPTDRYQKDAALSDGDILVKAYQEPQNGGCTKTYIRICLLGYASIEQFFKTDSPDKFVSLVRKLHAVAQKYKLDKYGYKLSTKFREEKCFDISADCTSEANVLSSSITLNNSSKGVQDLVDCTTGGRHQLKTTHWTSISKDDELKVFCNESYLTLHHLAGDKKEFATNMVKDLFTHVKTLVNSKDTSQWKAFGAYVGSKHGQKEARLHFIFKETEK